MKNICIAFLFSCGVALGASRSLEEQLFYAVDVADVHEVKHLIKMHVNVNACNNDHEYVLHRAIQDDVKIAKALLKSDAILVNIQEEKDGLTALHIAVANMKKDCMNLLLSRKDIELNIQSHQGQTALHIAAFLHLVEYVQALVHAGADVSILNNKGKKPIDLCNDAHPYAKKIKKILMKAEK